MGNLFAPNQQPQTQGRIGGMIFGKNFWQPDEWIGWYVEQNIGTKSCFSFQVIFVYGFY